MERQEAVVFLILNEMPCCEGCHHPYRARDISVLSSVTVSPEQTLHTVSLACHSCNQQSMVQAMLQGDPNLHIDASTEEWDYFESMTPLAVDDVLDMHLWLRAHSTLPDSLLESESCLLGSFS